VDYAYRRFRFVSVQSIFLEYNQSIMSSSSSLITFAGVILILHSAFSCLHYRGLVLDLPDVQIPPLDVKIEVGLGFLFTLVGQLLAVGPLRSIVGITGRIAQYKTRDFDHYQHRGTAMRTTKAA